MLTFELLLRNCEAEVEKIKMICHSYQLFIFGLRFGVIDQRRSGNSNVATYSEGSIILINIVDCDAETSLTNQIANTIV